MQHRVFFLLIILKGREFFLGIILKGRGVFLDYHKYRLAKDNTTIH